VACGTGDVRQGLCAQGLFDLGVGGVELAVEGAQREFVFRFPEWAVVDAGDRVDGIDDVEQGDRAGWAVEEVAAVFAALRGDEPGPGELGHDLEQVGWRDVREAGELSGGDG
jgi:hypothetical protein